MGRRRPHVTASADRIHARFPTVLSLRDGARRRIPGFAFDAIDGGAGEDGGVARGAGAFGRIDLLPRYGVDAGSCSTEVELFGRRYAAPFGVAPVGMIGMARPGGERYLAAAANQAGIPFTAGVVSGGTIEEFAEVAGDVLWVQLYRLAGGDHAAGFDLVRRAQAAGAHVLVLTLDAPVRTRRPREVRHRLRGPFRLQARTALSALRSPAWLTAYLACGLPSCGSYMSYLEAPTPAKLVEFMRGQGGSFTWDEVARYRDRWRGPLVVKGILRPQDAETAVSLGVDGIQVSNHGGRQSEGLPPAVDMLPAIVRQVGDRATVLVDSGVRSGLDVVRALVLGAKAALLGRAFLWAVAALGRAGPAHVSELLKLEVVETMRQLGIRTVAEAAGVEYRHLSAW